MSWLSSNLRRLWTREKPDGKKGWGALRYLIVGGTFAGLALWTIHRMDATGAAGRATSITGGAPAPVNPAAENVKLREVAKAAQSTQPVDLKAEKGASLASSQVGMNIESPSRGSKAGQSSRSSQSSFFGDSGAQGRNDTLQGNGPTDSIFAALHSSDHTEGNDGRPQTGEDGSIIEDRPPPTGRKSGFQEPNLASGNGPNNQQLPPIESLVAKNSRALAPSPAPNGDSSATPRGVPTTRFLPRGEIIPVYIMQTVETGKLATLVEFAVAKTIWFNGKPVLPWGTRFTATAGLGVRNRITFNVDSVRRRDGLEIALSGMVLGTDKATGMQSYYVPPPTMAQVAPYIGEFAQAFADITKARLNASSIQVAGVTVSTQPSMGVQAQEAAVASMSQALSGFVASQLTEIKEQYAAYNTVIEGSSAYVQLTANTDFTALWDDTPRGVLRTIGTPNVVPTESLYRQREIERNEAQTFSAMMNQATTGARASMPNDPMMQATAGIAQGAADQLSASNGAGGAAMGRDPFAR